MLAKSLFKIQPWVLGPQQVLLYGKYFFPGNTFEANGNIIRIEVEKHEEYVLMYVGAVWATISQKNQ